MLLQCPLLLRCSMKCLREQNHSPIPPLSSCFLHPHPKKNHRSFFSSSSITVPAPHPSIYNHSTHKEFSAFEQNARSSKASEVESDDDDDDDGSEHEGIDDDSPSLMTESERKELRRKIRQVLDSNPDVEEETNPAQRKIKMEKLLSDYPLVVEEDDPDWPDNADGWGFNLDQFFNKITIKNVKKDDDDDEDHDSDKEVVWQDDDYIRPIRDISAGDWEDTVFKDFNPLVILVHNRYKRPLENEKARSELERAVQMFWNTGLPSPRCVAVDAVVEEEIVSALRVSNFPEILFTKAGKILHRDRVVRTADEWSKIMAFFYYKAVRPQCLAQSAGENQEKIPSLS